MDPRLLEKFINAVKKYHLIEKGDKILVGLSGGPDSVFLLKILLDTKDYFGTEIGCLHINHLLRGEESFRDEEFCKKLCEEFGIPLITERVNVRESKMPSESIEEAARRLRYDRFREVAMTKGFNKVALAHTASDVVESFFINLIRGAGIWGLRGMPVKRDIFIRPLIFIFREDILTYLENTGLPHVIDSTNLEPVYLRNAIRLRLIPLFEELRKGSLEKVRETTELVGDLIEYLEEMMLEIEKKCSINSYPFVLLIDYSSFLNYHNSLQSLFLCKRLGLTYDDLKILWEIVKGKKIGKMRNYYVYTSKTEIAIFPEEQKIIKRELELSDFPLVLEDLNMRFVLEKDGSENNYCVGLDSKSFPIFVKGIGSGDRLSGRRVSEIFERKKIPAWKRSLYPAFVKNGEIFWIPGIFRKDLGSDLFIKLKKVRQDEYWLFDNRRTN
ncbi:MAG: tRNA lysidine(34) synthetase TilS [Candidatus Hydrothermia bacterium]